MRSYFRKLYTYNQWANTSLLQHIKQQSDISEVNTRLAHIVSAEEIWYDRIKPLGFEPLPLFEMQPLDVMQQRLEASAERWLELINTFDNLDEIVAYTTTEGRPYESSINDLLLHVANHGTYHRGQIATLMRQSAQEPMATDYIVYIRGLEKH